MLSALIDTARSCAACYITTAHQRRPSIVPLVLDTRSTQTLTHLVDIKQTVSRTLFIAYFFSIVTLWMVRNQAPRKVDKHFRKLQLVSAAVYSLSHGSNDAQKTIGIISVLLFANGILGDTFYVPTWTIFASYTVIALGTLLGGWKVINTLGMRITKLTPFGGFSAETSAGLTIIFATILGIPVSTTHTITGAIIGVGSVKSVSAVRWGVAKNILWAWILTIPLSAGFAMLTYFISTNFKYWF